MCGNFGEKEKMINECLSPRDLGNHRRKYITLF